MAKATRLAFRLGKMLADLTAGSAVDPSIGDGQFPVQQEGILLLQAGEASCLECVALDVVNALFDFPLVTGRAGRVGQKTKP